MKFRHHRSLLTDSMATVVEIVPTREALAKYLDVPPKQLSVRPYTFDSRISWNTHIVLIGEKPVGFTDGPLES